MFDMLVWGKKFCYSTVFFIEGVLGYYGFAFNFSFAEFIEHFNLIDKSIDITLHAIGGVISGVLLNIIMFEYRLWRKKKTGKE